MEWLKWRANLGQEFVIGGYVPSGPTFDSIPVGHFDGKHQVYAGQIRAGFGLGVRSVLLEHFAALQTGRCRFANLPECGRGRWVEGITAEVIDNCQWIEPRLVAHVEFLEWTPENRLAPSAIRRAAK